MKEALHQDTAMPILHYRSKTPPKCKIGTAIILPQTTRPLTNCIIIANRQYVC